MATVNEIEEAVAEDVVVRQTFSMDYVHILSMVVIVQLALIGLVGSFIFVQITMKPSPIIFQLTSDDQIIEKVSLDQPSMTSAALLNLVTEAITQAYTFNYRNLPNQVDILKPYFDDRGLANYVQILKDDPSMTKLISDKLIVSSEAEKPPQIIREGNFEGRYTWQIKAPLLVTYQNVTFYKRQELILDLIVWRVPETVSPNRVKITTMRVEYKQSYTAPPKGPKAGL